MAPLALEQFTNAPTLSSPLAPWTTLTGTIVAGDTSLGIASASAFPASAQYRILIDDELLLVTAGAATTTWTVSRGVEGTTAATHAKGASVAHVLTAAALLRAPGALTTTGDLPYLASTGAPTRLAAGSTGHYLRYASGIPTTSALLATDLTTLPGSDTQVLFNDGGALGANAGLTFEKTAAVLSLGSAISLGTSPATSGAVRVAAPVGPTPILVTRNSEGTANVTILELEDSGVAGAVNLHIGQVGATHLSDLLLAALNTGVEITMGSDHTAATVSAFFGANNWGTSNYNDGILLFGRNLVDSAANQTWFGDTANPVFLVGTPDIHVQSPLNFSGDTTLTRGATAGFLTLGGATTSNAFAVANGTNPEFGSIAWSGNNFILGTQGGVNGGTARDTILGSAAGATNGVYLATEATSRWQVTSSGHIRPVATATYDIGDSSKVVRNVYATLTNATGLPISTGVSGLGTGVATFLATPSSANLASAITDETGSGALVFATNPTLSGVTMTDATDIVLNTTTGTKIGTATTQKLAFFNSTPVVQPTRGATLTNNVTSGGTDDTIANFTDLTLYVNDSTAIRNDIYQLARIVRQHDIALRALGLVS